MGRSCGRIRVVLLIRRLTHCDFNPKNILIDREERPVLIDWEFAMAADRMIDIGNFFRFETDDYPTSAADAFASGYGTQGPALPACWRRLAKLIDLTNMADFAGTKADYQKTFRTARIITERTLRYFEENP